MKKAHAVRHIGELPSPVNGMNMGSWLGQARMAESEILVFLARTDLELSQRNKVQLLLTEIRVSIAEQLRKTRNFRTTSPLYPAK